MSTKIAVTAQNRKTISGHAGACRNFYIYTVDDLGQFSKELLELTKDETLKYTFHEDTSAHPQNKIFEMDVLLTKGIGLGGVHRLANHNVDARIIQETDPDVAVKKYLDNSLIFLEPEDHLHKHDKH